MEEKIMTPDLVDEELEEQIEILVKYFNIQKLFGGHELVRYRYFVAALTCVYRGVPSRKVADHLSRIYGKQKSTILSLVKEVILKSIRSSRIKYEQLLGTKSMPAYSGIIEVLANWLHTYQGVIEPDGLIKWEKRDSVGVDNRIKILYELTNAVRLVDPSIQGIRIWPTDVSNFVRIYYVDKSPTEIYVGSCSNYDLMIDAIMACMTTWRKA